MPHVITLTGPSGAGKSTTLRYFLDYANSSFRPEMVPKYTTRPPHDDDEGEVICRKVIPDKCDLVYEQYGVRYGLELETIFDLVAKGKSPVVILNDVRAVEDVRNALGGLVRSVFVFRESPTPETSLKLTQTKGLHKKAGILLRVSGSFQSDLEGHSLSPEFRRKFREYVPLLSNSIEITLEEESNSWWINDAVADQMYIAEQEDGMLNIYKIDQKELKLRLQKAQALYRIYIENIHLFNHVIINSGTYSDLQRQVNKIVLGLIPDKNWPLHREEAV